MCWPFQGEPGSDSEQLDLAVDVSMGEADHIANLPAYKQRTNMGCMMFITCWTHLTPLTGGAQAILQLHQAAK